MGFGEDDQEGKVPFSLQPVKGVRFITVDGDLDHLAEVVFARFLYCKVTLLHPLSILHSLERSHCINYLLTIRRLFFITLMAEGSRPVLHNVPPSKLSGCLFMLSVSLFCSPLFSVFPVT